MEILKELLERYGGMAWQRRWIGVATMWIVCLLGWSTIAVLPDQFEASARVYIDADAVLTPLLRGIAMESSLNDEIDLLQHMLLSRPNIERIIAKTDLQLQIHTGTDMETMVRKLGSDIKVVAQPGNIFSVTYRNTNRQLAFDVVQAVLASFIENKAGDNRDEMEKASRFLDGQIALYEAQLRDAESTRAAFRQQYVDLLPGDNGVNRLEQARADVTNLTGQLSDARARRTLLAREVGGTDAVMAPPGGPGDVSATLREAINHLHELQHIYTDAYPDVISQKRLIESLKASAAAGGAAPADTSVPGSMVPNPIYEQLKLRLVETDESIESLQRQVDDALHERDRIEEIARGAPGLEARYLNLNRDYDVLRKNYEELLSRRESMHIQEAAQVQASNVKMVIIDPPQVPQVPVAPMRVLLSLAAAVAGLGAGIGVVAGLISLDGGFHSLAELRKFGLPVLGAISLAVMPPTRKEVVRSASVFAAACGSLVLLLGGVLLHFARRI